MNPNDLTIEEEEDIIEQLMDNPIETVSYSDSPWDEYDMYQKTDYFGLVESENEVHVFAVSGGERDLTFGGTFPNRALAMEKLSDWAYSTQEAAEQNLKDLKACERARISFEKGVRH